MHNNSSFIPRLLSSPCDLLNPLFFSLNSLLDSKRKELGDAASKLSNGLSKLIETRQKVEAMTVELEETKAQLAVFQKQCDEYLVVIVQQKRDAEEQEKTVVARSEKIAEEELRCQHLAEAAQKDLDEALPALEEAVKVQIASDEFSSSTNVSCLQTDFVPLFRLWKPSTRKIWGRLRRTTIPQSWWRQ